MKACEKDFENLKCAFVVDYNGLVLIFNVALNRQHQNSIQSYSLKHVFC